MILQCVCGGVNGTFLATGQPSSTQWNHLIFSLGVGWDTHLNAPHLYHTAGPEVNVEAGLMETGKS